MTVPSREDVWGPLLDAGHGSGGVGPMPWTGQAPQAPGGGWSPEYLDRSGPGHLASEEVAAAVYAPVVAPDPQPSRDPFANYVPPALLPLDDVSLGLADDLEGTGWIEAGAPNPLGSYMHDGPEEIGAAVLARSRAEFAHLDLMGGPQRQELTRVERHRRALQLARARRAFALGIVICLVAAIVGALRSRAAPEPTVPADARPGEGSAVLLVQKDGGTLTSLTLLVSWAGGGRMVFVPTGVGAQVPGTGPAALSAASSDPATTAVTVANLLGVRIDHWLETDSFGLEQLFGTYGSLDVVAPADLVAVRSAVHPGPDVDPELVTRTASARAGHNELDARQSVAYMNAVTADGELVRLARQADVWKAFLARLHDEPSRATALLGANRLMRSDDTEMREVGAVLGSMAGASSVDFGVLPVLATARGTDGTESFRLDTANVARSVAALPSAIVVARQRPRLGVIVGKGLGAPAVAAVVGSTVPSEFDLVLSSSADAAYDETLIVYYREAQRPAADAFRNRIGFGRVVKDLRDQDVVDVSVTLGSDAELAHPVPATEQPPAAGIDDTTDPGSR